MFDNLDDQEMLEAYDKAIKLNLEIDFICILKEELEARGLLIQIKGYK
ncbi:sporulation histidine kinase inhibitor Sda [Halalkalibacter akibai]|nr:sporulation histidine kinase inhibitor Sda [Halalkalibacter akibai]